MIEKRRAPRKDYVARVEVFWLSNVGQQKKAEGVTADVSKCGMSVVIGCPIEVGTVVEIRSASRLYYGKVVRATRSGLQHIAGVEILEHSEHVPMSAGRVSLGKA